MLRSVTDLTKLHVDGSAVPPCPVWLFLSCLASNVSAACVLSMGLQEPGQRSVKNTDSSLPSPAATQGGRMSADGRAQMGRVAIMGEQRYWPESEIHAPTSGKGHGHGHGVPQSEMPARAVRLRQAGSISLQTFP